MEPDGDTLPMGVGAPATRALAEAGYTPLGQATGVPVGELSELHGMGPKAPAGPGGARAGGTVPRRVSARPTMMIGAVGG